jgi:hypothetical protein
MWIDAMRMKKFNTVISLRKLFSIIPHCILLVLTPIILYGLINTVSNDVTQYAIIWGLLNGNEFFESFLALRYELGSLYVLWLFANLFSAATSFYLVGIIALSIKYYLFNRYLKYPLIAYFLYVITFAHILDGNQIRVALSACIIFYALFTSPTSKYTYIWLSLAAVLFHYSGIIILFLYFVRLPLLPIAGIFFGSIVLEEIVMSSNYFEFAWIWVASEGKVNFTNSFFIMQVFIFIVCAFNWKSLSEGQRRGALFNMIGVVTYISFADNPIVAHRIRELSQLGIIAILFFGAFRLTIVKLVTATCFAYIVGYNLLLIVLELMLI